MSLRRECFKHYPNKKKTPVQYLEYELWIVLIIHLLYLDSPEFIEQLPAIQYVPVGTANYSLTCTIVSHPASTIQWYNNGVPFSPNSLVYFMTSHMKEINHTRTTSMMTIEPITKADFANYSCNATNEVGSAVSKNAFIVTCKYILSIFVADRRKIWSEIGFVHDVSSLPCSLFCFR